MRFKKTMSIAIAAAMLTSAFCTMGLSASADAAASVKDIDKTDYSTYTTYSGSDLGASYSPESTTFKVWAPTSTDVTVKLYSAGSDEEADQPETGDVSSTFIREVGMELDESTGVWSVKVDGDLKNTYYTYFLKNDLSPKGVEVCDVYARAAGVNGNRAMVVDLDSTDPSGWENDSFNRVDFPTQANVWEVHIKDFSYDPESGVSQANKGKYMAFTEFETTLNNAGDVKTCMNYLKDLGISYVQINPMYDFGSVDETGDDTQFNWGYDPKNYNVPEGSYSSNPYDGNVRITEMKQMIQALHENGIGVIMDVVYNHTYASTDSWFNLTVPGYYYRQNADGSWSNGSGCGNDTASEREMFKNYMVDSIKYWADEYHLDGFRFDLLGLHDVDTMNLIRDELDKMDKKIITYGEGWVLGGTPDKYNWAGNKTQMCTQSKTFKVNERIGFFNDDARDALKGKAFDDLVSPGFVSGAGMKDNDLYRSIQGHFDVSNWITRVPGQNVMYACCHDNQTLWDRLVASTYGVDITNETYEERKEVFVSNNKLSGAIVLTSQGIPFVLAGEEFARTKYGDHNSYKSSPDINMLDWSRAAEYADIVAYYKGLIQIRNNFAAFADGTRTSGERMVKFETPRGVIGYSLDNLGDYEGLPEDAVVPEEENWRHQWSKALVYFNSSLTESCEITLPGKALSGIMGDMDSDKFVTATDALCILRSSIGAETLTDDQKFFADLDGDGSVTADDAIIALKTSVDLEKKVEIRGQSGEYSVIADKQTAGLKEIRTVSGTVTLEPNSALILVPKESYDDCASKMNEIDNADAYVVVNHIESETGKVLYTTTIKGKEGQAYTTQKANDLQIAYDLVKVPDNATGTMVKGTTEVNYEYKLFEGGVGTLTVRYVDEDTGKDLTTPTVTTARGGTEYTTQPKSFSWYELDMDKYPENASGVYTKEGVEVVYYYKYNKPAKTDELVTSTIRVKLVDADFEPYIYIWDDEGKALPQAVNWPGTALTEKDEDGWYIFTFENYNVYNWILNGGGSQTADMSASGDIWVVATGSAKNVQVYSYNPDKV